LKASGFGFASQLCEIRERASFCGRRAVTAETATAAAEQRNNSIVSYGDSRATMGTSGARRARCMYIGILDFCTSVPCIWVAAARRYSICMGESRAE